METTKSSYEQNQKNLPAEEVKNFIERERYLRKTETRQKIISQVKEPVNATA